MAGRDLMTRMARALVTDVATGEHVAEIELDPGDATDAAPTAADESVLPVGHPDPRSGRARLEVVVDGWRFEFDVEDADRAALRARATTGRAAGSRDGPTVVRAIIPGRVLSVAVVVGDRVDAGQQLLTVEAMKMQNELRAPRAGVVERVEVGVGATVELGDVLVGLR